MATHKAPSEVTIVSHEDRSALAEFVHRHWLKAALLATVIAAGILYNQNQTRNEAKALDESWEKLMAALDEDRRGLLTGDPAVLENVLPELKGTIAGPWALFFQAASLRKEGRYDEAIAFLARVKAEYPDHPLAKDSRTYGDSLTPLTQIEYLSKVYASEKKWRHDYPLLFENPAPAAGSPKARIQTDHGDIVVVLDEARAPEQVANFIQLVGEGFYNGLLVHRSIFGQAMETGDPTTKDPTSNSILWGIQGSENNVEKVDSGLSHFAGALSALPAPGTEEMSGSLITILAAPLHGLDPRNVVFGLVVEGLDIVEEISELPTDSTGRRPEEPATIQSITMIPGA